MVFEAAKFFFVSSQSRHLGFVTSQENGSQNLTLINVSSRPLPTSRQKVAVVVVAVKSEPLDYKVDSRRWDTLSAIFSRSLERGRLRRG